MQLSRGAVSPSRMVRLGWRSSCAGHLAVPYRPCHRPPSASVSSRALIEYIRQERRQLTTPLGTQTAKQAFVAQIDATPDTQAMRDLHGEDPHPDRRKAIIAELPGNSLEGF